MKKSFFLYCFGAVLLLSVFACEKADDSDLLETENLVQDEIQLMGGPDPEPALPDLIVSSITSSLTVNNTCPGVPSADATCTGGGTNNFTITAVVENITNVDVTIPFQLDVCIDNVLCGIVTINGLAGGATASRTLNFSLPCASGPPPYQLIQEVGYAIVDSPDAVNEFRENNNASRRYPICRAE